MCSRASFLPGSLVDHRWSWAWWLASRVSSHKLRWPKGCRRRQFLSFFWRNCKEWMEWLEGNEVKMRDNMMIYEDIIWRDREAGLGESKFLWFWREHFRRSPRQLRWYGRAYVPFSPWHGKPSSFLQMSWVGQVSQVGHEMSSKQSNFRNLTNLVLQNIRCRKVCQDWFASSHAARFWNNSDGFDGFLDDSKSVEALHRDLVV